MTQRQRDLMTAAVFGASAFGSILATIDGSRAAAAILFFSACINGYNLGRAWDDE